MICIGLVRIARDGTRIDGLAGLHAGLQATCADGLRRQHIGPPLRHALPKLHCLPELLSGVQGQPWDPGRRL